jgi:hypothetical protein
VISPGELNSRHAVVCGAGCTFGGAHGSEKHLGELIRSEYESAALPPDVASFQRQETIFIVINLALIAGLLLLQTVLASYWGQPSRSLLQVLGVGFLIKAAELVWVRRLARHPGPCRLCFSPGRQSC